MTTSDANADIPKAFVRELDRVVEEHLKMPFKAPRPEGDQHNVAFMRLMERSEINSYYELLQVAQLLCEPPDLVVQDAQSAQSDNLTPDEELQEEARAARKLRFKFEALLTFAAGLDPQDQVARPSSGPPVVPKPRKERLKGREAFLAKMDNNKKVEPKVCNDPKLSQHTQRVVGQARAYLTSAGAPGSSNPARLIAWWKKNCPIFYPDLVPGVRFLLGLPSGNAPLERIFGQAKSILAALRVENQLATLYLKTNAPALQMSGYPESTVHAKLKAAEVQNGAGQEPQDDNEEDVHVWWASTSFQ